MSEDKELEFRKKVEKLMENIPKERLMNEVQTLESCRRLLETQYNNGEVEAAYKHVSDSPLGDKKSSFIAGYAYATSTVEDLITAFNELIA